VILLEQGFDALAQRVALLRQARDSIDVQTFIWSDDVSGRYFFAECLAAARRGVRVRILADALFRDLDGALIAAATAQIGLEFRLYNPTHGDLLPETRDTHQAIYLSIERIQQRMHTKVLIVDGRYAITGGRNIEDTYFDLNPGLNFLDRDILVEGSVTTDIQASFDEFWDHELSIPSGHLAPFTLPGSDPSRLETFFASEDLEKLRSGIDSRLETSDLWIDSPIEVRGVYYHADPPGKPGRDDGLVTTRAIHYQLCAAEQSIHLQSPYFVTTKDANSFFRGNERLEAPRQILVHTNSLAATDNWATYAVYQREKREFVHYPSLQLFEIKPRPDDLDSYWSMEPAAVELRNRDGESEAYLCLHAKSLVLDRRIAMIGSFNLDPRSANINTEVMLEIDDSAIAEQLAATIEEHMAPANSWVAAKRQTILGDAPLNDLLARMSSALSQFIFIDPWPIANTSLYELREGQQPCKPTDPEFFDRYRAVGSFPETNWDPKVLSAEIFRTAGPVFTPIL
jgi:phosphatidylserine/phosphatidylglycerophosphate/cardiolipin synthase-like enzyme